MRIGARWGGMCVGVPRFRSAAQAQETAEARSPKRRKGIAERTTPRPKPKDAMDVGYLGCQDACGTHGGREFEV